MDHPLSAVTEAFHQGKLTAESRTNIELWMTAERYRAFRPEIAAMIDQGRWEALNDAFYQIIPFGTAGRRGPVGPGPNRINDITIAEGAQGVADYVREQVTHRQPRVVIAYDTRLTSVALSRKTAEVMAGNGLLTYLFDGPRATPELSFCLRHLGCDAGIVISASHNPPGDNGFKAYGSDGGQVPPPVGKAIIKKVTAVKDIQEMPFEQALDQGLINLVGREVDRAYYRAILEQSVSDRRDVRIAYSPIHGAGMTSVLPVLEGAGFTDIHLVEHQKEPDGHFPNVKNHIPNPEVPTAMEEVLKLGIRVGAQVSIASDPDADRLAVAAPLTLGSDPDYRILSGNQVGALLGAFVLDKTREQGQLRSEHRVMTTCVTSSMLPAIARSFGVTVLDDLLVGFKYVAEQIERLPDPELFLFGTEESIGYMKGPYTRDKDAAMAALLVCELAAELKARGMTLWQGLDDLYRRYGYFAAVGSSVFFEGMKGSQKMAAIMARLRHNPPLCLAGETITAVTDRMNLTRTDTSNGSTTPYDAPLGYTDNLLILTLNGDPSSRVAIRPSGTEPKIKFYYLLHQALAAQSLELVRPVVDQRMKALVTAVEELALSADDD